MPKIDCAAFWEEFDSNTEPGKLNNRKPPLTDAEKKQRREDVQTFMADIGFPYFMYLHNRANGKAAEAAKLDADIKKAITTHKARIERLSHIQNDVMKKYFPPDPTKPKDEIDFEAFQKCVEGFANGDLGDHFMDSRDMWIVWIAFAKAAASCGIAKWKKLCVSLLKGAVIDYSFPQNRRIHDPKTGRQIIDPKKKLTPADVDKIKKRVHEGTDKDREKEENEVGKMLFASLRASDGAPSFFAMPMIRPDGVGIKRSRRTGKG